MSEKIDALMHNISILMKTLAGPTGSDYVNNFLINNYREYDSEVVEDNNVFVINDINNIASVQVWSVISSLLSYSISINYTHIHAGDFITNSNIDFEPNGVTVLKAPDLGNI